MREIIDRIMAKGLKLSGIARELGVPHSTVSRWYNGHHKPMKIYLDKLIEMGE